MKYGSARLWLILFFLLLLIGFADLPVEAAVKITSVVSSNSTVSKGQTGIIVEMEVENLDLVNPTSVTVATLTYTLGRYETTLNSPSLPAIIPAAGKVTFKFTLSVFPLTDSGVCIVDGQVYTTGGNDLNADLSHKWTIQQPAEVVVTSIVGPAEVTKGSSANQAIMDVGRSGEADILIDSADLFPITSTNYANWTKISPDLPQNFSKTYWWDERWLYRKQMTITNRSASALPKTYEVKFVFDHQKLVSAGKSLANGDDIRVVYFDGVTFSQIERYLDPVTSGWNQSGTTIWFRLQDPILAAPAASDKYALYYGTDLLTAANPPDNPANIFCFFDDFESGQNGWSQGRFPTYIWPYADRWERGTAANGDGLADEDERGPLAPRSGLNYWATDLDNRYDNSGRATSEMISLRTPDVALVGKLNPTLTFWDFYDNEDGGAFDFGVLRVCEGPVPAQSDPMQPNGTQLQLLESVYMNQHGPWQRQTYSLAPSVGKVVYLEFTFGSDWASNAYGWAIDDVLIRQIAVPEPDNPVLGVEEQVPLTPTIKVYFDVNVADNAVSGDDIIDGIASGTEGNTGQTISDDHATLPLEWFIRGQDFKIYSNTFYSSPKDTFNIGEAIYGKGTGYELNVPCLVKWFDPSLNTILSSSVYPDSSGNIYCSRIMQGTDTTGRWKIVISNVSESVVFAETSFNLNSPAQLVSTIILPEKVISGQEFKIIHRVSNAGQTRAIGVGSSVLASWGGGNVTSISGPIPTSLTVPGGGSAEFVWTAVAGNQGQLTYRGNCSGTVEGTANSASSQAVTSNVCTVLQENFSIKIVDADDSTVTKGQTGIVQRVTFENTGTADLRVTDIDLLYRNGAIDESDKFTSVIIQPAIPAVLNGNPFPVWWNSNYAFRHRLRIAGNNQNFPAGCSARISINTNQYVSSGRMQADADDWRVVFWNDTAGTWTELDRHYVSNEITWFKLQRDIPSYGIDEGYFIYYGNPAAINPPVNLNNVYLFYENWELPLRANGFTRYNANADINGDAEWRVGTDNTDGIYLARNQWDGGNPLFRDAQALCFRRLDFPNTAGFAEAIRNIDTQTYPAVKLSWWRYYDDNCDWDGGVNMDWARVVYWDGAAFQTIINYPGNGPDDSAWHYEEYDLSGFTANPAARLHFRANFWQNVADWSDRIVYDDIKAIMAAPDCIGLTEETQLPTKLIATFSAGVLPTAPTGVYTLDASATFQSIIGTGTYIDPDSITTDSWTVSNQTIETFSNPALTVNEEKFPQNSTVYARFTGFTPGAAIVRWYDGYPTGNLVLTNNPTADGSGGFTLSSLIPAAAKNGVWAIAVSQGGLQVATGSLRVLALPEIGSNYYIAPAQTTVGTKFLATLEVKPCVSASDFNFDTVGLVPSGWTVNTPAKILVANSPAYENDPLTNYLGMVSNTATTLTAEKALRFKDCSSISISYDYSLVWLSACSFFVEYSTNGGGAWTTLATKTAQNGAGIWVKETLNFPDLVGNTEDFRLRFRFVTTGAVNNMAYIDNVFIVAQSPNYEDVSFQPKSWIKDPSGTGDATIVGSPLPVSQTVSIGQTAVFSAEYMPVAQTNIGSNFYLHGPGAPSILASGLSMKSSTQLNASDTITNGVGIFLEALSAAPAAVNLGLVEPGSQSGLQTLTVANDGNIDLEHVRWEFYNLASDPYLIPNSAISVVPEKVGSIAIGGNKTADIRVSVPAGTVAGVYKANQFVYEDNDQDGNSMGEPIGQLELKITVPSVEKLRAATDSLFLGSFLAGEKTSTATVLVTNVGNLNLSIVRFVPVKLTSGGNTIASNCFNLNPQARGFLVKGSSYFQNLSLSIPPGTPSGDYSGTCFFLDDKNANLLYEAGEASYPIVISVKVGTVESFSLSTGILTLPNTLPGNVAVSGDITLTNTGNIPLNYLRYEIATLSVSGENIGPEYVSFAPDPIPSVNSPGNNFFKVFVVMPPGQPNPGGNYEGEQRVYNDKNQNGIWDAGESFQTFKLRIRPGTNRGFVVSQDVANLGAGLPNDLVSGNIEVMNIGNDVSDRLKWFMISNLTSDANSIPAGILNYLPANGWVLSNAVGASQIATISLTIPGGQAAGTYLGKGVLYRDANNNGVYGDDNDASDTFLLQVEVGVEGVDILDASPLFLGAAQPADSTAASVFSVKNIGERTLTNLKYVKPDLTSGALPPIPVVNQIYSNPDPLGLIAGGVTIGPSVYVNIPANCAPALYSGQMRVYQDENNNDLYDGVAEVSDILDYEVQVLSRAVLAIEPSVLDLGSADKGQIVQKSFTGANVGNIDLTKIKFIISSMVDGGNTIPVSSLSVTIPETPWQIPFSGITSEDAVFTVNTSFTTPTGNYTGNIAFWEDSNENGILDFGEANDVMQVRLAIGKKDLTVLEDELNYGVVEKGTNSSNIKFTVRNIGTVTIASIKIGKSALVGPGSIPVADLIFSSTAIAPPNLNPGVTREVGLYIKTGAGLPSGVYSGIQTIYADINGNGIFDLAIDPYDTFVVKVTITSGGVLSYELVANPAVLTATIGRGHSVDLSFILQSLCSNVMTNVDIQKDDLASDATILPLANFTFNPASGISINAFAQVSATVTVAIPGNIPAGHYTGYQHSVDLDHTIASTDILLDITVPKSILNLSPLVIDLGNLTSGASYLGDFSVLNAGLNDANLFFTFSDFIGPTFTIPAASASVVIPSNFLVAGDVVAASISVIIDSMVPSGNYVGTFTLTDFGFPAETVSEMSITFSITGIVDSVYQTITNKVVSNSVNPSQNYVFSAFVCATESVSNLFEAQLSIREWRFDDSISPLSSHIITVSGAELNKNLGKWFRVSMPFTSSNSPALGSFTYEITVKNGDAGDTALFDGCQFEKSLDASGLQNILPTPWVEDKGIVSPMPQNGLESANPYYTW